MWDHEDEVDDNCEEGEEVEGEAEEADYGEEDEASQCKGGGDDKEREEIYRDAVFEIIKPKISSVCGDDEGTLRFMVIDVFLRPCAEDRNKCEAVLVGRGEDGGSVCIFAEGWQPYLYIQAPRGWKDGYNEVLRELIEEKLQSRLQLRFGKAQQKPNRGYKKTYGQREVSSIFAITTVKRKSIFGYSPGGPSEFLKIEVANPFLVRSLLDVFDGYEIFSDMDRKIKEGFMPGVCLLVDHYSDMPKLVDGKTKTFNSNLDSVIQFMADVGLFGCQWCEIVNEKKPEGCGEKKSLCHHEKKIHIKDLIIMSIDEYNDLGPLRVLSFDIEAAGRKGVFPDASIDPVIQIALHFHVIGSDASSSLQPILLSLKSCDSIEGASVICFENELEMLNCFTDLVTTFDADVITGYNICNFDFPYLLKRVETLSQGNDFQQQQFKAMSRLEGCLMFIRETVFQSAQTGKRKRVRVGIAGRVCLDMFTCIQNNQSFKLEKYSLNAVSEYFLGDKKVDLPFTQITPMWERDSASRKELGIYCLKDAQLPIDLMITLDSLTQVHSLSGEILNFGFKFNLQCLIFTENLM